MKTAFLLFASLGLCWVAHAESPDSIPNPRITNHSSIYDGAHVLNDADKRRIDDAVNALEKKTQAQMMIVTVQTLDGMSIEDWSNSLHRRIGLGHKGKDDGAMFVFAITDRKSHIEVGFGLEDRLTDARVGSILRDQIRPAFRKSAYGQGILDGVSVAANYIEGGTRPTPRATYQSSSSLGTTSSQPPSFSSSSGNSYPSNGSGVPTSYAPPNSSPSFPGGLVLLAVLAVGGIGALAYAGTRPRRCPRCSKPMNSAEAPLNELSDAQQYEKRLGSRSFQKCTCPTCGFSDIVGRDNGLSGYMACQICGNRTARAHTRTVSEPTYDSSGIEETIVKCEYPPCGHQSRRERTLPRRTHSSSMAAGGFIGGVAGGMSSSNDSGSWGGSSSSDSGGSYDGGSGSSYGGGDSGGGGASSDW